MSGAEPAFDLAEQLFAELHRLTHDGVGITRDTYGAGEEKAHDLIKDVARRFDLAISTDAALNLYVRLPGRDPDRPAVFTGSHLDSVRSGGNYDGAAGVLAGLAVLVGWRRSGFVPPVDTVLMVIRAEESSWFPVSYLGSKAAFGILPPEALGLPRSDTGRSLAEHLRGLGGAPDQLANRVRALDPEKIARFVEVHIEQGPVLVERDEPVGVVTGIRGSFRFRNARARGAYAHSGATPRSYRKDAVLAVARLVCGMDDQWQLREAAQDDLTVTFGRLATDPAQADFAKVSGNVEFCIDVRSFERTVLDQMEEHLLDLVHEVSASTGVRIALGQRTTSEPASMDMGLRQEILAQARALGITAREMPCGAGHDAALFAAQGVPSAMIFIRNANGSHNPREAMAFADFVDATRLLERAVAIP
jgi:N-carbamoyl-L-amino-acid hydrolase